MMFLADSEKIEREVSQIKWGNMTQEEQKSFFNELKLNYQGNQAQKKADGLAHLKSKEENVIKEEKAYGDL